jgi:hypothetical protein
VTPPVTGTTISGRVLRRQRVPVFNRHRSFLSVSKLELRLFFGVIVSVSYSRLGFPSFGFGHLYRRPSMLLALQKLLRRERRRNTALLVTVMSFFLWLLRRSGQSPPPVRFSYPRLVDALLDEHQILARRLSCFSASRSQFNVSTQ